MAVEQFANGASTTLASGITSGTTSITVASASGFPSSGNFRLLIGTEILLCTSISGTTLTCTRGVEGTSPTAASSGAAVTHILTAGSLTQLSSDMLQNGPIASLPRSARTGAYYKCTDSPYEFIYNGSSWDSYIYGYKVTQPILANFTQVKVDKSTFDTTHGGILWSVPGNGSSEDVQVLSQSIPGSGAYYVDSAWIAFTYYNNGGVGCGLSAGTSTSSALSFAAYGWEASFSFQSERKAYNSPTSFNNNQGGINFSVAAPMVWLRVYDDGTTNKTYYNSPNGYSWYQIYQESRTNLFTPNQGIVVVSPFNSTTYAHLLHFSIHT